MPPRQQYTPLTPQWWVDRLYWQIQDSLEEIETLNDYYEGEFPLPWLAPQAAEDFRRILKMTRSNFMGLVVDSMVERMAIEGFRVGDDLDTDSEVWRIWQANNMDADFDQGLLEAAIAGHSYLLVEPNAEDPKTPHIHIEHPSQATVEFKPGTNRRESAAGLKVWEDEWTEKIHATLFLPKWIYKFEADKPTGNVSGQYQTLDWQPREGVPFRSRNPVGEVPLYELPNNPRLLTGGRSEIGDVMHVQDRICKTIADRLMTQDYGAFPQKWATGWPESDAEGNPTPPIAVGRNRMVTTDVQETKFGQWDAAEVGGYILAKAEDVKDIASRTRMPAQYLLGEMNNVNGETLKASESGLVAKVRQRSRAMSDPVERAMRAVRRLAKLTGTDEAMEVIWRNPEFRTEGELVDALFKIGSPPISVPRVAIWEKWGASQTEIERWKKLMREQRREDDVMMMMTERYRAMATQGIVDGGDQASGSPPPPSRPGAKQSSASTSRRSGGGSNRRRNRGSGGSTSDGDGDGVTDEELLG